ncbi:VaFE repeat-containing surface-anchored protein [Granulicatella elegans]|uniref:VaFE repeat-containing surface-anchored protein n=1 Tax=Granulicatella elegans TaxID=137732 RepID=UPI001D15D725|nr:VaFE repeat-containing surface-anchored protein [Granulicatella elegans]UEA31346.1 VaFE repeat-containing surface-anchored protein [Granulicatella elegans]
MPAKASVGAESENLNTSTVPENTVTVVEDKNTQNDNQTKTSTEEDETVIEKIPEPIGGGSSGGGGGGFFYRPTNGFLIIKKDENGNPMKVAFKITNLITGETHILVTDSNGKSNKLFLNKNENIHKDEYGLFPENRENRYEEISGKEIEKIVEELRKSGKIIDPEKDNPDIFGNINDFRNHRFPGGVPGRPPVPVGPKKPPVSGDSQNKDEPPVLGGESDGPPDLPSPNANDKFLEKGIVKDLYKYEELNKGENTTTNFYHTNYGVGSLKLDIYFDKITKTNPGYRIDSAMNEITINYGKLDAEKFNKVNYSKIIDYAKKRLAYKLIEDSKGGNIIFSDEYGFNINVYRDEMTNVDDVYKVEELRTDTNNGYSLKTFYIKRDIRDRFYIGDNEKNITEPAKLIFEGNQGDCEKPNIPNIPAHGRGGEAGQVPPISPQAVPELVVGGGGGSSVGGSGSGCGSESGCEIPPTACQGIPTFTIVNEKFDFKTYASHPNQKGKNLDKSTETKVTDKIEFDKLSEGKSYKFVGKLIHKASGKEVKTKDPIIYETGKLTSAKGEASITITFDASAYSNGDEFVLTYEIFEDGLLAGKEYDLENKDQTFSIIDKEVPPPPKEVPPPPKEVPPPPKEVPPPPKEVPPPPKEVPPPPKEVPPPSEEVPPPSEEVPPPSEEVPPPSEEVPPSSEEVPPPSEEVPPSSEEVPPPQDYIAPETYDPGIGLDIIMLALSGAGLILLRKKNK